MTGYEPLVVKQDWNRATEADWADVLRDIPLFSRLGKRQRRKLAHQAEFSEFAHGDTVISTGAPADAFYVILSGEAIVRGKPAARTLRHGDFFGELALLDGKRRSATVIAADELHVMRLPGQAFLELVNEQPGVGHELLRELGSRIRRAEQPA